jgi:acetyltransferase-like isoleucine patch superfamily enzyme
MPINNVKFGKDVIIPFPDLVNLYGCDIRDECFIGPFVEIQKNVVIGERTRIQSHSFICSNVTIGKDVFIGHGVMFINDKYPVHRNESEWGITIVGDDTVIGSNATILPVSIGKKSLIGAGSVVTKNIPEMKIFAGNPAKFKGDQK